ncbi:MAG: hypothetical protein P8X74_23110 [Reinekea sp.]
MTIVIMILAVSGIILQLITRNTAEKDKSWYVLTFQYLTMISIVVLSAFTQLDTTAKDSAYKKAKLEIEALSKVSQYFFPVMENTIEIQNNFLAVRSYLGYQRAKKENPSYSQHLNWHIDANDQLRSELNQVKKSLKELHHIAVEIVRINGEIEGVIPLETIKWSSETLKINLDNIDDYLDPYAPLGKIPKKSVIEYSVIMGKAYGAVIRNIKEAASVIRTS